MRSRTLILLVVLGSGALYASPVYSNFGPPGTAYNVSIGWDIPYTGGNFIGEPFTPAVSTDLQNIQIALEYLTQPFDGTIAIEPDAGLGMGPNGSTILESFNFVDNVAFGTAQSPLTFNSLLHPLLNAGQEYWVVVTETSGSGSWMWNNQFANSVLFSANQAPNNQTQGAFAINAAPEPTTFVLLAGTLLLLAISRRKLGFLS